MELTFKQIAGRAGTLRLALTDDVRTYAVISTAELGLKLGPWYELYFSADGLASDALSTGELTAEKLMCPQTEAFVFPANRDDTSRHATVEHWQLRQLLPSELMELDSSYEQALRVIGPSDTRLYRSAPTGLFVQMRMPLGLLRSYTLMQLELEDTLYSARPHRERDQGFRMVITQEPSLSDTKEPSSFEEHKEESRLSEEHKDAPEASEAASLSDPVALAQYTGKLNRLLPKGCAIELETMSQQNLRIACLFACFSSFSFLQTHLLPKHKKLREKRRL